MINSTLSIISSVCIELESQYEYGLNISWKLIPCQLHNGGYISRYRIRYGPVSNNISSLSVVTISTVTNDHEEHNGVHCHAESIGSFTCLLSAQPLSIVEKEQYQFQVAAVNKYGTGPFSEPINVSPSSLLPGSYFERFPAQIVTMITVQKLQEHLYVLSIHIDLHQ